MSFLAIGDLAQSFQSRRENAQLTADLQRLAQEVASGRKSELRNPTTGDFGALAGIESALARLDSFTRVAMETAVEYDAAQRALERIERDGQQLAGNLLLTASAPQPATVDAVASEGAQVFEAAISTLNTAVGGRSLFAGTGTDGPALDSAAQILTDLQTATAGAATAEDLRDAVALWFAPGGGFETGAYLGQPAAADGKRLSPESAVDPLPLANDPAIAGFLSGAALGALLDAGALTGQADARAEAARLAGDQILGATPGFVTLRASVGTAEEGIARATQALAAEEAALEIARSDLVAVDPFEAASELETVRAQLETKYLLTARLSQLSLSNFLR
ncbi:MAG: flagellin [Pseudomonadota bacterium]